MEAENDFDNMLKTLLSASDYDTLHERIHVSKRRLTFIKMHPHKGRIEEAVLIAKAVGMTTKNFIDKYFFGWDYITVGDYKKLGV